MAEHNHHLPHAPKSRRGQGLLLLVSALVAAWSIGVTWAAFNSTTTNATSTFQAAASFGGFELASGSYTGDGADDRSITGVGFQPDLVIVARSDSQIAVAKSSTMAGQDSKRLANTGGMVNNRIQALDVDGFEVGSQNQVNANGATYYWVAFGALAGELEVGSYTGNGAARTISTGFDPAYVWVLPDSNQEVTQRSDTMSSPYFLDNGGANAGGITGLVAGGFDLGTHPEVNQNGTDYHYVTWAAGSSVATGSYLGNGSDNRNINTVGFEPEYTIIRSAQNSDDGVHRPAAIVGDLSLYFRSLAASPNLIQDYLANGFEIGTNVDVNRNGTTYNWVAFQ